MKFNMTHVHAPPNVQQINVHVEFQKRNATLIATRMLQLAIAGIIKK